MTPPDSAPTAPPNAPPNAPAIAAAWPASPLAGAGTRLVGIERYLRRNTLASIGLVIILVWVVVSLAAPWWAPLDPVKQDFPHRLNAPSGQHLFGTDQLGRDILSRVIYGGRISLPFGFIIIICSTIIGTVLGSLAGFLSGMWDAVLMRFTDIILSFPGIILMLAVAAALGPGLDHAAIALIAVWWPGYARVVRGLVISVKENDYVLASRSIGTPPLRILWRHVLPNCLGPAVVMATLDLGGAVLTFAALSFLGLGAVPPTPEWGSMVASGTLVFEYWWVATFPGLAILSVVLAFNFVGDGLRDALDPRLRRSL